MLYIVPTPIGNLGDITYRAVNVLREADFIIAENPAHSARLLQHYEIPKKEMVQFADHNEQRVLDKVIAKLKNCHGALVSDAGTPGISDPGFRLVRACWENGIQVDVLTGANAAITALVASGLPTDKFLFVGFLPKTEPKFLGLCQEAKTVEATLVAYESPQRIVKTLQLLNKAYPEAHVFIGRELTKLHQEYLRGISSELVEAVKKKATIKGEIVIVISFK